MSDTIIKNWFFVNLEYDTNIAAQVLGGIVVEDNKGRWQPGDYACTSKIVESLGNGLYQTRNSCFECLGEGQEVSLMAESIFELRRGVSPEEYLALKDLNQQGIQAS
jgi:hypothetical protein